MKAKLKVTTKNCKELTHEIVIPKNTTLKVVVKGRRPNCYLCGQRGYIKIQFPDYE